MGRGKQPHQLFQWAGNRKYYAAWMTKEIWEWYFDHVLGREKGGRSIKVIVCAAPQTLISIAECCCNWKKQFEAGFPAPLKLIGATCEPIFSVPGATKVEALKRIHGYYQPLENLREGRWNPRAPLVLELKENVEKGWARLQRKYTQLDLPALSFLLPAEPGLEKWVNRIAAERISEGRRPFNCLLSGPNRSWIPYWMRKIALEASVPDLERPTAAGGFRRKLCSVKLFDGKVEELTYGFSWGFHPIGSDASRFGYCAHIGRDVLKKLMADKLEYARGAMMGLGPEAMDDPRLLDVVGPLTEIGAEFPSKRKRTSEEFHANCLSAGQWYSRQVPHLLFGKSPKYPSFAEALVERIYVAYHAWKEGYLKL